MISCRYSKKSWIWDELGSFSNLDSRIFGHGTLSGDFIPQPKSVEPPIEESEYWKYKSVNINNADNITIVGITIVNAAFHTFNLVTEMEKRADGADASVLFFSPWLC